MSVYTSSFAKETVFQLTHLFQVTRTYTLQTLPGCFTYTVQTLPGCFTYTLHKLCLVVFVSAEDSDHAMPAALSEWSPGFRQDGPLDAERPAVCAAGRSRGGH
jgi:hypothetical protein